MSLTEIAEVSLIAPDHLFIGGEWVKPSTSDQIDVINSSTEEVFFRVAEANAEDMDRAIAAAREAFDRGPWPRLTHGERAEYLVKIASALEERAPEIGSIWSGQAGILNSMAQASGPGQKTTPRGPRPGAGPTAGPSGTTPAWPTSSPSRNGTRQRPEEMSGCWCGRPSGSSVPSFLGTGRWV
jgi:hypothetical protein